MVKRNNISSGQVRIKITRTNFSGSRLLLGLLLNVFNAFFCGFGVRNLKEGMLKEVEQIVKTMTEEDRERLRHELDHCLSMMNKFCETRKAEHYVRAKSACQKFWETLTELEEKASKANV